MRNKITKKITKKTAPVVKAEKKVTKKVTKVKPVKVKIPLYDPKIHVKLADLARTMDMDYRSAFLKQKRLGIFSFKCLQGDREVVCFTQENADKIKASVAPFITSSHIELANLEKDCKIKRPKMLLILSKLDIVPEKRRRFEDNPRSVLTVKLNHIKRIKEAVKNLC